jgi:hypothetical protein
MSICVLLKNIHGHIFLKEIDNFDCLEKTLLQSKVLFIFIWERTLKYLGLVIGFF